MTDMITIRGVVGTDPQLTVTQKGVAVLKFRIASHDNRRDRETGEWNEGPTNWFSVSAFRALAENSMESIAQGDRLVIFGKLQVRQFDREDGSRGTSADIDAYAIGHDLKYGVSQFRRTKSESANDERSAHADSAHIRLGKGKDSGETNWAGEESDAA